jgi:hypothetical protein
MVLPLTLALNRGAYMFIDRPLEHSTYLRTVTWYTELRMYKP